MQAVKILTRLWFSHMTICAWVQLASPWAKLHLLLHSKFILPNYNIKNNICRTGSLESRLFQFYPELLVFSCFSIINCLLPCYLWLIIMWTIHFSAYGNLSVRSLLDTIEHCMKEFDFPDPYLLVSNFVSHVDNINNSMFFIRQMSLACMAILAISMYT